MGKKTQQNSQRNSKLGMGGLLVLCSHKLPAKHTWLLCLGDNSPGRAAPHVSACPCAPCSWAMDHITLSMPAGSPKTVNRVAKKPPRGTELPVPEKA